MLTIIKRQSINSTEIYAYGTNKEIIQKNEEIKCISVMKKSRK